MLPEVIINNRDFLVNDSPYMFRGFQIGDGDFSQCGTNFFQTCRDMKVNLLRLWVQMKTYMPTPTTINDPAVQELQRIIDTAEQYGIYTVLTNGMYKIGPFLPGGYGLPAWVFTECGLPQPATEGEAWQYITYNECVQANIGKFLQFFGEIGNRNAVLGIDLMNEPQIRGLPATQLYEHLNLYLDYSNQTKPRCVAANFIDYNTRPAIDHLFVVGHGYMGFSAAHFDEQTWMDNAFKSYYWVTGANFNVPLINIEWMLVRTQAELDGYTSQYGLTIDDVPTWYHTYIQGMENNNISWCHYPAFSLWQPQHWIVGAGQEVKDYWQLNETVTSEEPPPPPPNKSVAARTIGSLGLPLSMIHYLWLLREKHIRPEVHMKLHPLV